jgi:hypothetical protein
MTTEQIITLISNTGYAAIFFAVILGLLGNMLFLYDEGVNMIYYANADEGWLRLLFIPVEFCTMMAFFVTILPYMF